jgi:hypothetical protein
MSLGILLYVLASLGALVLEGVLGRIAIKANPPKAVKAAELCEIAFATILLAVSVFPAESTGIAVPTYIGLAAAAGWYVMAIGLFLGFRAARFACLVLSLLRAIPCAGAALWVSMLNPFSFLGPPFSVISMYLLFFTGQGRGYFMKHNRKMDESENADAEAP